MTGQTVVGVAIALGVLGWQQCLTRWNPRVPPMTAMGTAGAWGFSLVKNVAHGRTSEALVDAVIVGIAAWQVWRWWSGRPRQRRRRRAAGVVKRLGARLVIVPVEGWQA